jgi:hypothetical protein
MILFFNGFCLPLKNIKTVFIGDFYLHYDSADYVAHTLIIVSEFPVMKCLIFAISRIKAVIFPI